MTMWYVIMLVTLTVTGASLLYLSGRVGRFRLFRRRKDRIVYGALAVFSVFGITALLLNTINAIVCAIYFAMIWGVCDFAFWIVSKIRRRPFERYYAGMLGIVLSVIALSVGWYQDHHVRAETYDVVTDKQIKSIKIVMFADSHIGTTFGADGFAKHIAAMQAENPDLVVVAGDFVDDDTPRADMVASAVALGKMKTTYGVYLVLGNHDKGYYGAERRGFGEAELVSELERNGVKVLKDEAVRLGDAFYLIGRRDFSVERERGGKRKTMTELVGNADKDKYMIVADHQPADYKNQAAARVDLVLSGHTHGGQLFPFNRVGKWIGANDLVYGREKRGDTDFIVTSGLSDWAIKFKTGCRSEYVVVNVKGKE